MIFLRFFEKISGGHLLHPFLCRRSIHLRQCKNLLGCRNPFIEISVYRQHKITEGSLVARKITQILLPEVFLRLLSVKAKGRYHLSVRRIRMVQRKIIISRILHQYKENHPLNLHPAVIRIAFPANGIRGFLVALPLQMPSHAVRLLVCIKFNSLAVIRHPFGQWQ